MEGLIGLKNFGKVLVKKKDGEAVDDGVSWSRFHLSWFPSIISSNSSQYESPFGYLLGFSGA